VFEAAYCEVGFNEKRLDGIFHRAVLFLVLGLSDDAKSVQAGFALA